MNLKISKAVSDAIEFNRPVVALESTVITHGLPYPLNIRLAADMEAEVIHAGVVPATIAVSSGQIHVGADSVTLENLALDPSVHKISSRDIGPAIRLGWSGGTTVAGTMLVAQNAGIRVFATGGIGGVHRPSNQTQLDISADLPQLARTPLIVVCAGVKAILDIPGTLEYLETWGVPVIGYQTDEFPAFYSRSSGLKTTVWVDNPVDVVAIAREHWAMGMTSAILLANPIPEGEGLDSEEIEGAIETALEDAKNADIHGQDVTPFLLTRMSAITHNSSLQANLSLLLNNARVASEIAIAWAAQSAS
jgi:pseudouridylate synthase